MTSSSNITDLAERRFRRLVLLTVLIIYLLILAGGIVRGTGSGMGCPDWPKCFGRWIPPTSVTQLPPNYQAIYGAKLKGEVEFNATKTWIEYVNRLLGVLSGFFVLATLLASLPLYRRNPSLVWGSFAALLLIGANGWLGSKVVSTELAQYMITAHLLLAVLVLFSLLFVFIRSRGNLWSKEALKLTNKTSIKSVAIVALVLTMIQLVLGTEVRDSLDKVVKLLGYEQRDNWISGLDWRFYVHRSFSLVVLGVHLFLIGKLKPTQPSTLISGLSKALIAVVVAEIATGAIMGYFAVPAAAQPIHLLLAVLLVGIQFIIIALVAPTLLVGKQHDIVKADLQPN
ncbi:heme A synthase [Spirosoma luteolum]